MMEHTLILTLAGIGLLAFLCQWIAWSIKLPAILFLLITGIILGPVLGWVNPDVMFAHLLAPMIQLSVAIILFEGSLTLKFNEIAHIKSTVRNLTTIGVVITAIASAFAAHWIFHLPANVSALFGAIISVTGPTVVVPMLRTVRPSQNVANILRWEGILIDPIGAVLAVLTLGFILAFISTTSIAHVIFHFFEMIIVATVLGIVAGYWLGVALRRHVFPEYLHNIATLSLVLFVYTISNFIDEGSGLLSVALMGIWLTNMQDVHIEDILDFKENLSIMLISGVFILLAARIHFHTLHHITFAAIALFLVLQFVIRPLNVFLCSIRSNLTFKEKILLSWICPRGIVAAAVAALFAIRLEQYQVLGANALVLITFLMIIATVTFQSLTARLLAKLLKVAEPEPKGFLIIGANQLARLFAQALQQHGFRALLTSMNWENIRKARMDNIQTFYGNPISEHADRHLDLVGIGQLVSLSPQTGLNTLATLRYRREFGRKHIFTVNTQRKTQADKHTIATRHQGQVLFDGHTFSELSKLIAGGAKISSTQLTESFDYKSYQIQRGSNSVLLFALDPKSGIYLFTTEQPIEPKVDWTIVSIVPTVQGKQMANTAPA